MSKPDKRKEILRATLELIAEQGFHGAPMAMIAEKAGVAAGTIYCYFKSRDALITELYQAIEERMTAYLQEGHAADAPIRERFLHLCTGLLRYFIAHPLEFRYLEQFHNSPYGAAFRRDTCLGKSDHNLYMQLFEQGIEQRVIQDVPLIVLAALTFGPMISIMRDHILGFVMLDDRLIERIAASCWEALRR
ncbi:MAG TPA: TetR/AcrR family transcriptional regulator [Desulfuromonadaceae bacterium]